MIRRCSPSRRVASSSAYLIAYVCGSIALLTLPLGLLIVMAVVRDIGIPGSAAWIVPVLLLSMTLHGLSLIIARSLFS